MVQILVYWVFRLGLKISSLLSPDSSQTRFRFWFSRIIKTWTCIYFLCYSRNGRVYDIPTEFWKLLPNVLNKVSLLFDSRLKDKMVKLWIVSRYFWHSRIIRWKCNSHSQYQQIVDWSFQNRGKKIKKVWGIGKEHFSHLIRFDMIIGRCIRFTMRECAGINKSVWLKIFLLLSLLGAMFIFCGGNTICLMSFSELESCFIF